MYLKTIDFARYSSIRVGQPEEVLMIEQGDTIPAERYLIGGANNLLISSSPPPMMMLGKDFATIQLQDRLLTIGASMPTGRVVSFARRHNLADFEFFAKLPGTVGGMLAMNAGVKAYEIFQQLHSVEIEGRWREKREIPHGYRFSRLGGIATAARFHINGGYDAILHHSLLELRRNQPLEPSAGSAFKNPPNDAAGRLIEAVGLKGVRKGDMAWSPVHANFLVNMGQGSFEDAKYLLDLAKERVWERFHIVLQEEIKLL